MRLKSLREKKGLTQKELAKIFNVSGQTILNWENGLTEPSIKQLIELANFFKVSTDYLLEINIEEDQDIENIDSDIKEFLITLNDFIDANKQIIDKIKNK